MENAVSQEGFLGASIFLGILSLVAIKLYFLGLSRYRMANIIKYTPTSKSIAVAPGIAELSGRVVANKEFTAPYSGKKCAYYKTLLYKWSGSGKNRRKELVVSKEADAPFFLEDGTGKVLVDARGGEGTSLKANYSNYLKTDHSIMGRVGKGFLSKLFKPGKGKMDERLREFVKQYAPECLGFNGELEIQEIYLEEGDQIFVVGVARETGKNSSQAQITVAPGKDGLFCISEKGEKETAFEMSLFSLLSLIFSPLLLASILAFFLFMAGSANFALPAIVLLSLYSYVAFAYIVEIYNGLVVLKNNIMRAEANVSALLKKRAVLIPQLETVAKEYASHEKWVMQKIASLREIEPGKAGKEIFAIAERYPGLKSNKNFILFQKQLEALESQISAARAFMADSITLYNTRIESFPYVLASKATGMKPIPVSRALG